MQRDPYTQAKAQLTNINRENQEHLGARNQKVTEVQIQAAAKQIDEQSKGINKPESAVKQTVKKQKKERVKHV